MSTTRRTFTSGLTACAAAAVLPALPAKATPSRRDALPSQFWRFDLLNGGIVSRGPGEPPPQITRAVHALLERQPPFNGVVAVRFAIWRGKNAVEIFGYPARSS